MKSQAEMTWPHNLWVTNKPVTKHELILNGNLGSLMQVELHTDGYRYPSLQVLKQGEVYMLASPISVGAKVVLTELQSRAIDLYNQGRAARGWFMNSYQSMAVVSAYGTAGAKRIGSLLFLEKAEFSPMG
jgi:hypothetical protein